jgi:oxygen-dependent protoporphyrinogen oxidase
MDRKRVIVVGGGISGLSAAWTLRHEYEVVVLESSDRLGGKIASTMFRGQPLDLGPDAFIVRNPAAADLCDELGLTDQLIEPSTKSAAIYSRRELHPFPQGLNFGIPTDLRALARSGVVNFFGVLRTLYDLASFTPALSTHDLEKINQGEIDPTVAQIFTKALGPQVVAALIDPLIGGINAGDVRLLSFSGSMPQIAEQIAGKKHLMRALRKKEVAPSTISGSIFRGLRNGMYSLVRSLERQLTEAQVTILTNEQVHSIAHDAGDGFTLATSVTTRQTDHLVLATPAFIAAQLLTEISPALADELRGIPYAGVATVTMGFHARDVPPFIGTDLDDLIEFRDEDDLVPPHEHLLPGSGVLIARSAQTLATAISFTSTKWPRSSVAGEVVLRVSVGRHNDDRLEKLSDQQLLIEVQKEIGIILGIHADPLETIIQRWPASFPQYVSGHQTRVRRIDQLAIELGIDLVGGAYHGIGIPACIAHAQGVAERIKNRQR